MKRIRSILIVWVLIACISCSVAFAEEGTIELSVPKDMPEDYLGYYWIDGIDTKGVTFVIKEASYNNQVLKISIIQLPNDDYTSLVDNQVDVPSDDPLFKREIETALQYGRKTIGTLCDIQMISDENGNNLFDQYKVSTDRNGACLTNEFQIYLPPDIMKETVTVQFAFGVNEDLRFNFPMFDVMDVSLPLSEYASTR